MSRLLSTTWSLQGVSLRGMQSSVSIFRSSMPGCPSRCGHLVPALHLMLGSKRGPSTVCALIVPARQFLIACHSTLQFWLGSPA